MSNSDSPNKSSGTLQAVIAAVVIALVAGGTSPWHLTTELATPISKSLQEPSTSKQSSALREMTRIQTVSAMPSAASTLMTIAFGKAPFQARRECTQEPFPCRAARSDCAWKLIRRGRTGAIRQRGVIPILVERGDGACRVTGLPKEPTLCSYKGRLSRFVS
jgi:hypothetical protein